jgi:hypothetical protein
MKRCVENVIKVEKALKIFRETIWTEDGGSGPFSRERTGR